MNFNSVNGNVFSINRTRKVSALYFVVGTSMYNVQYIYTVYNVCYVHRFLRVIIIDCLLSRHVRTENVYVHILSILTFLEDK